MRNTLSNLRGLYLKTFYSRNCLLQKAVTETLRKVHWSQVIQLTSNSNLRGWELSQVKGWKQPTHIQPNDGVTLGILVLDQPVSRKKFHRGKRSSLLSYKIFEHFALQGGSSNWVHTTRMPDPLISKTASLWHQNKLIHLSGGKA